MATASAGKEEMTEWQQHPLSYWHCPICITSEHFPMLIFVCGHTICESCIKKIQETYEPRSDSPKCPLCNREFSLVVENYAVLEFCKNKEDMNTGGAYVCAVDEDSSGSESDDDSDDDNDERGACDTGTAGTRGYKRPKSFREVWLLRQKMEKDQVLKIVTKDFHMLVNSGESIGNDVFVPAPFVSQKGKGDQVSWTQPSDDILRGVLACLLHDEAFHGIEIRLERMARQIGDENSGEKGVARSMFRFSLTAPDTESYPVSRAKRMRGAIDSQAHPDALFSTLSR